MTDPHRATREFLEERPEAEHALESVLAADQDGTWGFDDVEVDSGTFGELVSRGIVESRGDEYRVANPDATAAALRGEPDPTADASTATESQNGIRRRLDQLSAPSRDLAVGLTGAFAVLLLFRTLTFDRVFRENHVILPSNDPYHYLYWVEQLLAQSSDPFDLGVLGSMSGSQAIGEPLVYAIGWWLTALLGGGPETAAGIVAWIPVASALVVGACVYLIAVWTTDDERVGVASVVMFALLPAHALYSGIGFFDHHAIDYAWLALSITGVLWLARDLERRATDDWTAHLRSPLTWIVVVLLGIVVAAMVHNWNGSPILLVGFAVYATLRATSDIRTSQSPLVAGIPLVTALGLGFLLGYVVHRRLGWQEPVVVFAPLLVALGVGLVVVAATVIQRVGLHPGVNLGLAAVSVGPLWVGFDALRPEAAARLRSRIVDDLFGRAGIAETRTLFDADYGLLFGPVDQLGWFLFLALPVLAWVSYQCVQRHEPRWLVVAGYAYALLGFGLVQIRFLGEATPVVAVLTGVGLVGLLSTIDLAGDLDVFGTRERRERFTLRPETMTVQRGAYLVVAVLLVSSLSLAMVPIMMNTVAVDDDQYDAAVWIAEDADDREGPAFVLSEWGWNRMYNHHVTGESSSYGFAQSNYQPFLIEENPDSYYDRFDGRVGYVAMGELDADIPAQSGYAQLFEHHGSATAETDGVGQFRLVHVTPDEEVKVFRPVAGATIAGNGTPGETVTARTTVSVSGTTFEYARETTVQENGSFALTVAYPGEYDVESSQTAGQEPVAISDSAVERGERTAVGEIEGSEASE